MKYEKFDDKILIYDHEDFNIEQILTCGQIFRYEIIDNLAVVYSKDKKALITTLKDVIEINTKDVDYFENFFDLKTDYGFIKQELKKDFHLKPAVEYGYGIRILNNDPFEIIVSFMISANNNIPRIRKSIEHLCSNFGSHMGEYFAFPTLIQLKNATVEDYRKAGLGYRSEYLYDTIQKLSYEQLNYLNECENNEKFNFLVSLKGIGEKVANCILLFGLGVKNVFPVDTWINKVYNSLYNTTENNRHKISCELTNRYKSLSGYAQQYFFYYFRDGKIQ